MRAKFASKGHAGVKQVPPYRLQGRYSACNYSWRPSVYNRRWWRTYGVDVYSCDYNGWADVPEEEREGLDAFETSPPPVKALAPIRYFAQVPLESPAASAVPPLAPRRKAA